MNRKQRAYQ
jgi:hypothetical protein